MDAEKMTPRKAAPVNEASGKSASGKATPESATPEGEASGDGTLESVTSENEMSENATSEKAMSARAASAASAGPQTARLATAGSGTGRTTARSSGARPAQRRRTRLADRPPRAGALGFPAVLDHELVAVKVTASATPITVFRWVDGRAEPYPMLPLHAVVWARAGRVTLLGADDLAHRLTLLAEEEHGEHRIGEHWPLGEPEGRARRVATATLRDLGDVLTFPVWLTRTSNVSARRNLITKRFLRELAAVSPDTVIQHNQTFGTPPGRPGQLRPYDHRGLVGQEGYPKEL
jgi:hypothetical protein